MKDDSFRAAKAETRRHKYHGQWAAARRIGPCGPASGGLATLVCESRAFRSVTPERPGPNWSEGRRTHTVIGAGGTQVHAIKIYGWPPGTPDLWKNQNALWKEMFCHVAGLGDVPWVMVGDWNATPDQLWVPALAPRAAGWLPDVGGNQPTCFPVRGEPTENYFSWSATASVGRPPTMISCPWVSSPRTRRSNSPSSWPPSGNRLGLSGSPRPYRTLRKERNGPRTTDRPWTKVEIEDLGAQRAWEAWAAKAEDLHLRRAGGPQNDEEPYKGRGAAPVIRMRMPLPIATHQKHGEVHGRAKIWTAQANMYRELARAREEHRTYYGDLLSAAVAANPPRDRSQVWAQRDQKIAIGRATRGIRNVGPGGQGPRG